MSAIEIVVGDFEPGVARVRYSTAGRPTLRLTSTDGIVEEIALQSEVAGCAEHDEGKVADYLDRWLRRSGRTLDDVVEQSFRHERVFVVVLRDGRKFAARSTADVVADLKAMASRKDRPRRGPTASPGGGGLKANLLARFLPGKA